VYGWLDNEKPVKWPFTVEFYVVDNWEHSSPHAGLPNLTSMGTLYADGSNYTVLRGTTPIGADQWFSVRWNKRTKGSIDVKKHLNFWRDKGMANGYIALISYGAEMFGKSDGFIRYKNVWWPNP